MRMIDRGLLAAAGVLAVSGWLSAQESSGTAEQGRTLFENYQCWQCHGFEGQGGAAPRIGPMVYPFEAFSQLVRHTNEMPAYSPESLSDGNLRSIWEYLRSRPEPPAVDDIPALSDL
jgi:mono/diheme cytochrome c family protein